MVGRGRRIVALLGEDMARKRMWAGLLGVALLFGSGDGAGGAEAKKPEAISDPAKVDADFAVQGEYTGELGAGDAKMKLGLQVIARGGGKFHAVGYPGGLPGDGWDAKGKKKDEVDGATADGVTTFKGPAGSFEIKDGAAIVKDAQGQAVATLKRIVRESPAAGAKAPDGAVVLFDGTSLDAFEKGARITEDKLLMEGGTTKQKFQAYTLHVEFRLPYMPAASGQGRGNSGCYNQGRYEVQILDSFGLKGMDNECGGIYTIKPPDVNMCFPPLSWQTYDIDYVPAVYADGKKTKNAVVSVKHNGVVIHTDVELTKGTTAAPVKEGPEPGPIHFQNHGNPVRFRNIWIVEKK